MSNQDPNIERPDPAGMEPAEAPPPRKTPGGNLQKALLYIALGILIGVLVTQNITDFLPRILPILMAIFIAAFALIVIAIIALPRIINYLAKRYTGRDVDVESAVGDIQAKANHIADSIAGFALAKADPEVRKNIRQDLPGILHYLVFSRLRNSGLRLLMTVFVAIGGVMGTILLYNQNELLGGQNEMLSSQNDLLLKQNEKIDNQILLDEASRRSSLNFLLGNVLDQVNEELKDPGNTERRLSAELIGRIAALSQSFQPYYFMEDGKMTERALSPERASLLLALVNSDLDDRVLDDIFEKTIFSSAYLEGALLDSAYLKDAYLVGTDFTNAKLDGAVLFGADLSVVDLNNASLSGANLAYADLAYAKLENSELSDAILVGTNFVGANLNFSNLSRADLSNANLKVVRLFTANLSEVVGLNSKMLRECLTISNVRNLSDSLAVELKSEIEWRPE